METANFKRCEPGSHDYEKVIFVKKWKTAGEHGFIWYRCKTCGFMKPSLFPCDLDAKGNQMSSNLKRVIAAHPNYPVIRSDDNE